MRSLLRNRKATRYSTEISLSSFHLRVWDVYYHYDRALHQFEESKHSRLYNDESCVVPLDSFITAYSFFMRSVFRFFFFFFFYFEKIFSRGRHHTAQFRNGPHTANPIQQEGISPSTRSNDLTRLRFPFSFIFSSRSLARVPPRRFLRFHLCFNVSR